VATDGRCSGAVVVVGLLFRVGWGAEWWIASVFVYRGRSKERQRKQSEELWRATACS
jgi:hypothetical protein